MNKTEFAWKMQTLVGLTNEEKTLCITDRAYLLFEGQILFHGTPEELSQNPVVLDKYLTHLFKLRKKDFHKTDEVVVAMAWRMRPDGLGAPLHGPLYCPGRDAVHILVNMHPRIREFTTRPSWRPGKAPSVACFWLHVEGRKTWQWERCHS